MKKGLSAIFLLTGTLIISGCQQSNVPKIPTESDRLNAVKGKLSLALQKLSQIRADVNVLADPLSNQPVDVESFVREVEARKEKASSLQDQVQNLIDQDTVAGQFSPKNFKGLWTCLGMQGLSSGFNLQRLNELGNAKELDEVQDDNIRLSKTHADLSKNPNKAGFASDLIMLELATNSHQARVETAASMARINQTIKYSSFSLAKKQEEAFDLAYGKCLYSVNGYKTYRKHYERNMT